LTEYLDFLDALEKAIESGAGEATLPTVFLSRIKQRFQLDYPHLRLVESGLERCCGVINAAAFFPPPQEKKLERVAKVLCRTLLPIWD
jgi:hypothetical protein